MKKRLLFLFAISVSLLAGAQTQYAWVQKAMYGGPARHRSTGLTIGNRGYMGLGHTNSTFDVLYQDWWEYDPGSDTWTQKANFGGGLRYHTAGFVVGNAAYVGTGRAPSSVLMADFWKYDALTNQWTQIPNFPGTARRGAVGFAINGKGYVGTGSYYADFYEYNPATNSWTPKASLPAGGRISAVGFTIGNKGYVGTGDDGGPSNDMWEYDPVTNIWTPRAPLPGLARMEAGGFELMGKGYIGTGDNFSSGTNYQDFWCFDPVTNSWVQVADFAGAARRYLTCFTIGSRAYAGLGTSGTNYRDLWEFGSVSGVEETPAIKIINVYPNPVEERALLEFPAELRNGELLVIDMQGKLVRTIAGIQSSSYAFHREGLPAGVYFLQVLENGTSIANSKIVLK
ncbi:MAG: hypothetical protein FD123_1542 [Bacteroidetes bacterium]|nr:MAG: hypothetical protein FD123_1542 [Bacteroidota bacterium]